ncbi:hypothetical protein C0J52_15226 [Blattella germanica]|nr:hypothetical protein C0J52_15226 [Blattella germanica]
MLSQNSIPPVKIILYYFNRGPPGRNGMFRFSPVYGYKAQREKVQKAKSKEPKAKRKLLHQMELETEPSMSTKTRKDYECLYCKGLYSTSNEGWVSCITGHITRALLSTDTRSDAEDFKLTCESCNL